MKIHHVLAANSTIPGSIPLPAPKAATLAGWDKRRHSASPPTPPSPKHRQPVQEGLERGRKSQHLSAVAGRGVRPSLLEPARQTEGREGAVPSQLAWKTWRGASTGPSSGPGGGVQEGHEVTRGSPISQGFLLLTAGAINFLAINTRTQLSSAQLKSTSTVDFCCGICKERLA